MSYTERIRSFKNNTDYIHADDVIDYFHFGINDKAIFDSKTDAKIIEIIDQFDRIDIEPEEAVKVLSSEKIENLSHVPGMKDLVDKYNNFTINEYDSVDIKETVESVIYKHNDRFKYQLLSRLQLDCEYFLGHGNGNDKCLWAENIKDQIKAMKDIFNSFSKDEQPEWISVDKINEYEASMLKLHRSISDIDNLKNLSAEKLIQIPGIVDLVKQYNKGLTAEYISENYNMSFDEAYEYASDARDIIDNNDDINEIELDAISQVLDGGARKI